jgi:replicative DNA helicase
MEARMRSADSVARLPVHSHVDSAEQALLGSLLIDGTAWARISSVVRSADLARPDHRLIFDAIAALAGAGEAHDFVTVSNHLERTRRLEAAGGFAYLGEISRNTPTAANVVAYAHAVRDRATARALSAFAAEIDRSIADGRSLTADELVAGAVQRLLALQTSARIGKGLASSTDLVRELVDDLDRRRDERRGMRIGLADFDELTGGLEPGDLVVIAARPGMGKTALLVTIASHIERSPAAIFSAEMPALQLMRRAIALESNVPQGRLRRAESLTDADWSAITPALGTLARRPLWIDDSALPSLTHIRAESFALKARAGIGLVLVDYVQLVQGAGANRYEQLRDVAYGLKALAKDLAVPVIMLAQLNRGVESREHKRPYMSDLRDSGAIEEAADIVGLLYSEGYYDPGFGMPYVLECQVSKHRNGERGECLWRFAGAHSRITVLEPGARAQYLQLRAKQNHASRSADL